MYIYIYIYLTIYIYINNLYTYIKIYIYVIYMPHTSPWNVSDARLRALGRKRWRRAQLLLESVDAQIQQIDEKSTENMGKSMVNLWKSMGKHSENMVKVGTQIPSGNLLHSHWRWPFISLIYLWKVGIFHSKLLVYQRVDGKSWRLHQLSSTSWEDSG